MNIDLDHLEAVAKAATQEPWRHMSTRGGWDGVCTALAPFQTICNLGLNHPANALHIATFDPPMALSMIERIRELVLTIKDMAAYEWNSDNHPIVEMAKRVVELGK